MAQNDARQRFHFEAVHRGALRLANVRIQRSDRFSNAGHVGNIKLKAVSYKYTVSTVGDSRCAAQRDVF